MISRIVSTWGAFAARAACVTFLITVATETARAQDSGTNEAILHIPHLLVLELFAEASNRDGTEGGAASAAVAWFEERISVKPKAVVLPLITVDGVGFKAKLRVDRQLSLRGDRPSAKDVASAAVEFSKRGMRVYVSVVPSLSFVTRAPMKLRDIVGDQTAQACINRDATQRLLKKLVRDGIEQIKSALTEAKQPAEIAGIVLDITNLWPMSATGEQIELTCYCVECVRALNDLKAKYEFDLETFKSVPNPWNLLLFDNPDTDGITYSDEFSLRDDDETLIRKVLRLAAGKKTFFPEFWNDKTFTERRRRMFAEQLVSYFRTRERLTLNAVARFFDSFQLENSNTKRIILTDQAMYNWTSGVSLGSLDDTDVCDEVWFAPTSRDQKFSKVKARAYMWNRASYYPNAFFDFAALMLNASRRDATRASLFSSADAFKTLKTRARQVIAGELGSAVDVFLLPEVYENTYVIVGMDDKIVDSMLKSLKDRFETELSGR